MSDKRKVATVIGNNKFVEGYVVERLVKAGYIVRVAVPKPSLVNTIRPFGNVGHITPLYCSVIEENTVIRAIEGADIVVNLSELAFGKNKSKLELYNVQAAQNIARICAAAGVKKFIHFSALGASSNSRSAYLASKKKSEDVVLQVCPSAVILRTSIIFGPEDEFLNKLGNMASYFPVMPAYKVNTKLQPVYVGDVADAVMKVVQQSESAGKIYELAGPESYTNRELINWLVSWLRTDNNVSGLSLVLIRLMAFTLQFMPGAIMTPALLNMMEYDSVLSQKENGLLALGIVPKPLELIAPVYLYCYRSINDFTELKRLQRRIEH
ncbi:complex I NDUFA9 subunit family protein [Commensalibacter papalotli (ex Servin-Garciduenas et al. 2014)]|uniref:3-beta-hydroxy-delta(5)-steroid dehydrogenase n=1 Tax=Commensalibacter papalotli (ex Servin-Garciduenas et al. 2014) TaxID=1208583 RepID=W7E649_9PROT|nr:complex I NDUFA9 subunit family protein [Commensalibacter papalotli (ex Servin-Garciduenas et al. 2014)]EUK18571.1 3-beta-hydroxy-delta(5)-steroid dehydrogenase [Commensalibacter papalotli (ex Servin-Garciduenas et al. 2014)]